MLRNWLGGLILLSLVHSSLSAAVLSCDALYIQEHPVTQTSFVYKSSFDYDAFLEIRNSYEQTLRAGQKVEIDSVTDTMTRIAFLEAVSRSRNIAILDLESIIQNGSFLQKYSLQRLIHKLDFSEGLSPTNMSGVLEDLYLLSHSVSLTATQEGSFLKLKDAVSLKSTIKKRIESEIVTGELMSAFKELGLVQDPSTFRRMTLWRQEHQNIENAFLTSLLNFLSIHYLGFISYIPGANLQPNFKLPAELIEIIKTGGFDSIYGLIRPHYKNTTAFNSAWNSARLAYVTFFISYGSVMLLQSLPSFARIINSTTVSKIKLEQLQEKTFNAEKVKYQLFKGWKTAFFDFEGRWPDPVKDKAEWDRNWNSIMNSSDEQLRVKYSAK